MSDTLYNNEFAKEDNSYMLKYGILSKNLGIISLYLHVEHPERYPEIFAETDLER